MKIFRERDGLCEICGIDKTEFIGEVESYRVVSVQEKWNVHHWHYKNIGKERRCDVSLLCEKCHESVHRIMEGEKPILYREVMAMFLQGEPSGAVIGGFIPESKFYERVAYLARQSIC